MAHQRPERRKRCRTCGKRRSITQYHKNHAAPDGRNVKCKVCQNAYAREYYARNRDWVLAQKQGYRVRNGETVRERKRAQYAQKHGYLRKTTS